MKRFLTILVVNLVIIGIIAGSSMIIEKFADDKKAEETDYNLTQTAIVMEEGQDSERIVSEIREAIAVIPPEVIRSFNEEGYKIIITSASSDRDHFTDHDAKTVTVKNAKGMMGQMFLYELCRYADAHYDYPTRKRTFIEIYELEGMGNGAECAEDYFAKSLSEYLMHPTDAEAKYPKATAFYLHLLNRSN